MQNKIKKKVNVVKLNRGRQRSVPAQVTKTMKEKRKNRRERIRDRD